MADHEHLVQFYEDDAVFVESAIRFLSRGLLAGGACIVVATPEHRIQLDTELRANGFDMDASIERGQYVAMDAHSLLAQLRVDGELDLKKVDEVVWPVIAEAKLRYSRVYALGEMVALLAEAGDHEDAIALEALWDQSAEHHQLSIFCPYSRRIFRADDNALIERICDQHSQVVP